MSQVDPRAFLMSALQRVIDGGDITLAELYRAIPDPRSLTTRGEKEAWEELSHWADDEDIRFKDAHYAAFKRDWMRDRLSALAGEVG